MTITATIKSGDKEYPLDEEGVKKALSHLSDQINDSGKKRVDYSGSYDLSEAELILLTEYKLSWLETYVYFSLKMDGLKPGDLGTIDLETFVSDHQFYTGKEQDEPALTPKVVLEVLLKLDKKNVFQVQTERVIQLCLM